MKTNYTITTARAILNHLGYEGVSKEDGYEVYPKGQRGAASRFFSGLNEAIQTIEETLKPKTGQNPLDNSETTQRWLIVTDTKGQTEQRYRLALGAPVSLSGMPEQPYLRFKRHCGTTTTTAFNADDTFDIVTMPELDL